MAKGERMKQPHPDDLPEKDDVADAIFARIAARPEMRVTDAATAAVLAAHKADQEEAEVPVIFTFFGLNLAELWGYVENDEWWNPDA